MSILDNRVEDHGTPAGWELVTLGIAAPRSHFCICCLTFDGSGMLRNGVTYCLPCWERRQRGEPCAHGDYLDDLHRPRKAG